MVYRFKYRHAPVAITTDLVPEDFKTRMKGFEVLEYTFYKIAFYLIDKGVIVYGWFIHDFDLAPVGIWSFFVNLAISLLQPLFFVVIILALWYLFKFYYYFLELDFVHSIVGPMGIHVLLGIVMVQLQLHPHYGDRRLNPLGFFIILKNGFVAGARMIVVPLYLKLAEIFRFILYSLTNTIAEFFKAILGTIKMGFQAVSYIYTFPVIISTQLLVGRGTILELLHLGLVLIWIAWPGYLGFKLGGFRNIFIGIVVSLAQIGVAIAVINKHSRRRF